MTTGDTIAIVGGGLAAVLVVRAKMAADAAVAAAAASIRPKSAVEKVVTDLAKKTEGAASALASGGLYVQNLVTDTASNIGSLGGDGGLPGLIERVKEQAAIKNGTASLGTATKNIAAGARAAAAGSSWGAK